MWLNKFRFLVCLSAALAIGATNALAAKPASQPSTPPAPYVVDANGKVVGPLVPSTFPAASLYRNGTERIKIMFGGVGWREFLNVVNTTRLIFADSQCAGPEVYLYGRHINLALLNEYSGYSLVLVFTDTNNVLNLGRVVTTPTYKYFNDPTLYELLTDGTCGNLSDAFYYLGGTAEVFYPVTVEPLTTFQAPFTIK